MSWCFYFFKQKTAYEMRISDWSSDVCSSDLDVLRPPEVREKGLPLAGEERVERVVEIVGPDRGRAPPPRRRIEHLAVVLVVLGDDVDLRSEERRVGKTCVSTCGYRLPTYH